MNNLKAIFISTQESRRAIIFHLCTLLSERGIINSSPRGRKTERGHKVTERGAHEEAEEEVGHAEKKEM